MFLFFWPSHIAWGNRSLYHFFPQEEPEMLLVKSLRSSNEKEKKNQYVLGQFRM